MEVISVLLTHPADTYLEEELAARFNLLRLWEVRPDRRRDFLRANAGAVRALVGEADDETLGALEPGLAAVVGLGAGLDGLEGGGGRWRERGVAVVDAGAAAGVAEDVADLALGLALGVIRRICAADRYVRTGAWGVDGYVRSGEWKANGDYTLTSKFSGRSVGIVGLGRIGRAIAGRAEAFGCPVSYFSRLEKPKSPYKFYHNLVDMAADVQVLFVACAPTAATHHIIDRAVLDALGPDGVLVSVGRRSLVDEAELAAALLDGRLGGAGLDVFEPGRRPSEQLLHLENAVVVPHDGSGTEETRRAVADRVVEALEAQLLR